MNKADLTKKITQKKEFSQLPKKDVEMAFELFDKEKYLDEEKVKLTRDLLRKIFSAFTSKKILTTKILDKKSSEDILRKHLSTRERFNYYDEIYKRVLKGFDNQKEISIIDLGAGINGLSYGYFNNKVDYISVEAVGQLVDLTNHYFNTLNGTGKNKLKGKAVHLSLFELEKLKQTIKKTKKPRVVFLFKTIDSLEMIERNYSKKLISEIIPLADRVIISFATKSMIKRTRFNVKRNWIINFIKNNFSVSDDFELGGERYLFFRGK